MALRFIIKADELALEAHDVVCVSGNTEELGNWSLDRRLPLNYMNDKIHGSVWKGSVVFPVGVEEIWFRCLVMSLVPGSHETFVSYWESNVHPRKVLKAESDVTEVIHELRRNDGQLSQGWLTRESIVQLKLFNKAITLWTDEHLKAKSFLLRAVKLPKVKNHENMDMKILVLNGGEAKFKPQEPRGREITADDNVVCQIRTILEETDVFQLELYSEVGNQLIGTATVLPSSWTSSCVVTVPIVSKILETVGQIEIEYLVVRPMANYQCSLEHCYVKHWNAKLGPLEIGHRGCGTSFSKVKKILSNYRENTVGSFTVAGNNGADFVEFDVQLSKDLVPVIYHDFYLCDTSNMGDGPSKKYLKEWPVKDYTLEELQNLEIYHVTERAEDGTPNPSQFLRDDEMSFKKFPTLKHLFESVDVDVGFNVEIKWGLKSKTGVEDLPNQIDMNQYLDVILRTIFENAGGRRIVISCFHPDVCTMLLWKQNKYPVLFLTQGVTKRYQPYLDPRTADISSAINFALSAGIMGIDVQTEEILSDHGTVAKCLAAGLVMFCWGEDNNSRPTIDLLKTLGLHGIIYDRIDQMNPGKKNVFKQMKMNEF